MAQQELIDVRFFMNILNSLGYKLTVYLYGFYFSLDFLKGKQEIIDEVGMKNPLTVSAVRGPFREKRTTLNLQVYCELLQGKTIVTL